MRTRSSLSLLMALALILGACATPAEPYQELTIVATTSILGDVVANVAGDDATVEVLIPLGVDPHEFQASSAQVAQISNADLVVVNGLGLEESLFDVLAGAESDGARVLEIGPMIDPIVYSGPVHDDDDDDDHDDDDHDLDPHIWMDPVRMADAARLIAAELSAIDSGVDWAARAESYAGELLDLDAEIAAMLMTVPPALRSLVTNHATFGYFADRYGWEVLGTVIPGVSTLSAPSSADLAELVSLIEQEGVRAIFVETTSPEVLAQAVAAEVGSKVEVVELHTESLSAPGAEADSLIGLLRSNASLITRALTGAG